MLDSLRAINQSAFILLRLIQEEGLLPEGFQFCPSLRGQPPFFRKLGLRLEGVVPCIQRDILKRVGGVLRRVSCKFLPKLPILVGGTFASATIFSTRSPRYRLFCA